MNTHDEAIDALEEAGRCFTADAQQNYIRAAQVYALLAIADAIRDSNQTPQAFGGTCPGSNQ